MKTDCSPAQKRIGVGALAAALGRDPSLVIVDVRTPGEFKVSHIAQARSQPLPDLQPAEFLNQTGRRSEALYVICQSGARAVKAIARLEEAGFDHCVLVEGGMDAWTQAGLPVIRGEGGGLSLLRQVQLIVGLLSSAGAVLAMAVDPRFALIPFVMGCGLLVAGLTGTCGLAILLSAMPWNHRSQCASDLCCS